MTDFDIESLRRRRAYHQDMVRLYDEIISREATGESSSRYRELRDISDAMVLGIEKLGRPPEAELLTELLDGGWEFPPSAQTQAQRLGLMTKARKQGSRRDAIGFENGHYFLKDPSAKKSA